MKLYLIRHAKAEEIGPAGDPARRLTERGREDAREVGKAFTRLGIRPAAIVASPAVRAQETARIIAAILVEPAVPVETEESLAPGAAIEDLIAAARSRAGRGDIALVGHQPELGRTAAYLLGEASGGVLQLRPSAVCGIEINDVDVPPGRIACLL